MTRLMRWALLASCVIGSVQAVAEEATGDTTAATPPGPADEQWLRTVWSEIDSLIVEQEYELQETVVTGGVRGAEAHDRLLNHYYFRGGNQYSTEEILQDVVEQMTAQLRQRRRPVDRAKLKYLTAICHDMLGKYAEAATYYEEVVQEYPGTGFAVKAQRRLTQLGGRRQ